MKTLVTMTVLLFLAYLTEPAYGLQNDMKSKLKRAFFSKKSFVVASEENERYSCVVEKCFPDLEDCASPNTKAMYAISDGEQRMIFQVHCVVQFGVCTTNCFNIRGIADNV
ncbi:UNVERIFIED_CONTAM: hypothetical protein FKN15_076348 [Acipenser sinensis]